MIKAHNVYTLCSWYIQLHIIITAIHINYVRRGVGGLYARTWWYPATSVSGSAICVVIVVPLAGRCYKKLKGEAPKHGMRNSQTNKRSRRETKAEKREEEETAMESTTLSYLKLAAPLVLSILAAVALTANGEEYSLLQLIFYLVTLCYIIVIIIITWLFFPCRMFWESSRISEGHCWRVGQFLLYHQLLQHISLLASWLSQNGGSGQPFQ